MVAFFKNIMKGSGVSKILILKPSYFASSLTTSGRGPQNIKSLITYKGRDADIIAFSSEKEGYQYHCKLRLFT